jgi:hypothetical protein
MNLQPSSCVAQNAIILLENTHNSFFNNLILSKQIFSEVISSFYFGFFLTKQFVIQMQNERVNIN